MIADRRAAFFASFRSFTQSPYRSKRRHSVNDLPQFHVQAWRLYHELAHYPAHPSRGLRRQSDPSLASRIDKRVLVVI